MLESCRPYLLVVARHALPPALQVKVGTSDLVQDTLLKAVQEFHRFEGTQEEQWLAWLRALLLNGIANATRHFATDMRQVAREVAPELCAELEGLQTCLRRLERARPRRTPEVATLSQGPASSLVAPFTHPHAPARLGRFQVARLLGGGGFGLVYLAWDPLLRREVAVKVPRPELLLSADARERFLREARTAAGLDHPNLLPVLEAGEEGAAVFLVSAYCPGPTLEAWLRERHEPLAARDAAELLFSLADAVAHLHARGVLHRDLKPGNILLVSGERGSIGPGLPGSMKPSPVTTCQPKITDFGLAKDLQASQALTRSGAIVGTLRYMSPEQADARHADVGPAADVYALGAILYEVLTGRPPFQGGTEAEILRQVLHDEPLPPRRLLADAPRDLETICLKCLEKEPGRRYKGAAALADDLRRFLAGAPIHARPARPWEKAWKWARRRPAVAGLVVVSALAVLTALTGVIWHLHQMTRMNRELQDNERQVRRLLYASRFKLAARAQEAGSLSQAVEGLDALRPAPGEPDLRGFEWYCLKQLCRPLHAVWRGHLKTLRCVAVASDGTTVATSSLDSHIKLWDVATSRVRATLEAEERPDYLAFSPDSQTLLSFHYHSGELVRWDLTSGRPASGWEHPEPCHSPVCISRDGRLVVVCKKSNSILLVVNLATDRRLEIDTRQDGDDDQWTAAAFSLDGTMLALGDIHGHVQVRDAATGTVRHRLGKHLLRVSGLTFAPDGGLLASASYDKTVSLWEVTTGRLRTTLTGSANQVGDIVFTPDGRLLVGAGLRLNEPMAADTPEILLWDTATGRLLARQTEHLSAIEFLTVTADGRYIIIGCRDQTVRLFDTDLSPAVREMPGHAPQEAWSLAFSPDGRTLASGGDDHHVRLWDVATGQPRGVLEGHGSLVSEVAYTPDGRTIVSASFDQTVGLWDAATGKLRTRLGAEGDRLFALAISPDGNLVAAGCRTRGVVRLWRLATQEELPPLALADSGIARPLAFTPDGKQLVAGNASSLRLWDTATWRETRRLDNMAWVFCAAFAPDGKMLATGDGAGIIRLWDMPTGQLRATLHRHGQEVRAVAFSPDGMTLASAGDDQAVRLWQTSTGEELLVLRGHTVRVNAVAFSPDGKVLASADHSGAIRLWWGQR